MLPRAEGMPARKEEGTLTFLGHRVAGLCEWGKHCFWFPTLLLAAETRWLPTALQVGAGLTWDR